MSPVTVARHDLRELATLLAPLIVAGLREANAITPAPLPRFTVEEFAHIVERCPAVIRRHIRSQSKKLPPADVDGPPYKIHPRALARWGVTPEIALARLQSFRVEAMPAPQAEPQRLSA